MDPSRAASPAAAAPGRDASLRQWLDYAERTHHKSIELGLARVAEVARRLAIGFDVPVVTVAGTNGKGSSCAMLEAILEAAGYRTALYTSPHLVRFAERCRLRRQPVDDLRLAAAMAQVEAVREGTPLTYFEFTTLAILSLMAEAARAGLLDAVILEVGMGGRLDAVNVVDADCALITSIDLDHMEWLGPDRESIGREKAGILRAGRPAVCSDPSPPASIGARAAEVGARLWQAGRDFGHQAQQWESARQWSWHGPGGQRLAALPYPALRGANQLINAGGVLAVLTALAERLPVSVQHVRQGLTQVEWPGRFQVLPGRPTVVLDVAHNPHAAAALAVNLDAQGYFPRTFAVFGAMADKDVEGIVRPLAPLVEHWLLCDLPGPRAASALQLRQRLQAVLPDAGATSLYADAPQALRAALGRADPVDRILVFGSFLTVGGVIEAGLPQLGSPHGSNAPRSAPVDAAG